MLLHSVSRVLLLAFVLLAGAHLFVGAQEETIDESSIWPYPPQLEIAVNKAVLRSGVPLPAAENVRYLAKLGIPFTFVVQDRVNALYMFDTMRFMTLEHGQCPATFSLDALFYCVRHPEVLETFYGVQRLRQLSEAATIPPEWILHDKYYADRAEATGAFSRHGISNTQLRNSEEYIATAPTVMGPLWVYLKLPESIQDLTEETTVSLWDIKVVTKMHVGNASESNAGEHSSWRTIRELKIDLEAIVKRLNLQLLLRARHKYAQGIAAYDAALREEAARATTHAVELLKEERKEAQDDRLLAENYRAFRQQRERERRESAVSGQRGQGTSDSLFSATLSENHDRRKGQARHAVACTKIDKALATLASQGALMDVDTRVEHLTRLRRRYHCTDNHSSTPSATATTVSSNTKNKSSMCDTLPKGDTMRECNVLCGALVHLAGWHQHTGQPLTVPQSLALLHSLYKAYHDDTSVADDDIVAIRDDERDRNVDAFSVEDFIDFAIQLVHTQRYRCCRRQCPIPRHVTAELSYAAALLQLTNVSKLPEQQRSGKRKGSTVWPRALSDIQQAFWSGSKRAAGTIATLRENGIHVRQHIKSAIALLAHSMQGNLEYMYAQLLDYTAGSTQALQSSTSASSDTENDNATVGGVAAERLLRYERYRLIGHSLVFVDAPEMTRSWIHDIIALGEQDLSRSGSSEVESEGNEEAASGHIYDEEFPPVSLQSSPRLVRVNLHIAEALIYIHGVRGVQRNLRRAECLLLSVLRKFQYACDIELLKEIVANESYAGSQLNLRGGGGGSGDASTSGWWFDKMVSQAASAGDNAGGDYDNAGTNRKRDGVREFMENMCHDHTVSLAEMQEAVGKHPMLLCSLPSHSTGSQERWGMGGATANDDDDRIESDFENIKRLISHQRSARYDTLHRVLLLLSHLYLIDEQQYDRAAVYAELAARLADMTGKTAMHVMHRLRAPLPRYNWLIDVVRTASSFPQPSSFIASAFMGKETIPILVLSSSRKRHQRHHGSVQASQERNTIARQRFDAVLRDIYEFSLTNLPNRRSSAVSDATQDEMRTFASIWLLLGSVPWTGSPRHVMPNALDSTVNSTHIVDAVYLVAHLMQSPSFSMVRFCQARPMMLGLAPHVDASLTPKFSETARDYVQRLWQYTHGQFPRSMDPLVILPSTMEDEAAQSLLDDAAPSTFIMETLRHWKENFVEQSSAGPLLYVSDLHSLHDTQLSRHTRLRRAVQWMSESVRYVFTETKEEALTREMGVAVLSMYDKPDRNPYRGDTTPASFVDEFVEAVQHDDSLRTLAIAIFAMSTALEESSPNGFSLILLEAHDRGNPYLAFFASYIAQYILSPRTLQHLWHTHHVTAQWHALMPHPLSGLREVHSLDASSPLFSSGPIETMQELMARAGRWQATYWMTKARQAANRTEALLHVTRAEEALVQCSGWLVQHAYRRYVRAFSSSIHRGNGIARNSQLTFLGQLLTDPKHWEWLPQHPYDCMELPAAHAQCLADLLTHARAEYSDEAAVPLARMLEDLTTRAAFFYGIEGEFDEDRPSCTYLDGTIERSIPPQEGTANGFRYQRVEPWNLDGEVGQYWGVGLDLGEGVFYNGRLHFISGLRRGAWWLELLTRARQVVHKWTGFLWR